MVLAVEGPTTEKLVEELQQATMQGIADLQVLKVAFSELQANIIVLAEWLKGDSPNLCWGLVAMGSLESFWSSFGLILEYLFVTNVKSPRNVEVEHEASMSQRDFSPLGG